MLEKWETADKGLRILREVIVDRDLVWGICERHDFGDMTYIAGLNPIQRLALSAR